MVDRVGTLIPAFNKRKSTVFRGLGHLKRDFPQSLLAVAAPALASGGSKGALALYMGQKCDRRSTLCVEMLSDNETTRLGSVIPV